LGHRSKSSGCCDGFGWDFSNLSLMSGM
jgi:hypothetical protein